MQATALATDDIAAAFKPTKRPFAPKRIMIVVTFANVAGAQIAALRLAQGLRTRGHEPRVIFLYQQVGIDNPYHPYEVILPRIKPGPRGYFEIAIKLAALVRKEQPDVMMTFLPLAHAIGQGAALLAGVRHRIAAHRMPIDTAQKPLRIVDLAYAWLGVYTNVTAVSQSVRSTCKNYPAWLKRRIKVIYNGLLDWTPSTLDKASARANFGIPDRQIVLVTVGRFVPQKNYSLLLRIVEQLDNAVLAVAGDGPLRNDIEREIEALGIADRVILLGNVERPDMPHLLAAGDFFVQTSTYEGNSNSMLEALRSGAVIIAHDVPEQREVIADPATGGEAGVLVPLNDLQGWVDTIRQLTADPGSCERLSGLAIERSARFSYVRMLDDYEAVVAS